MDEIKMWLREDDEEILSVAADLGYDIDYDSGRGGIYCTTSELRQIRELAEVENGG